MNSSYLYLIGRFIILVASQVLLIDNMNLGGYINPPLYILFILLLPFQISGSILLISSFLLGMSIDMFSNSTGLHAAAATFVAFMRPSIIRFVGAPAEYEEHLNPGIRDMGTRWFVIYSLFMILLHQFAVSLLESFYLSEFWIILFRMLISTAVTLFLIVIIEYLFMSRSK